MQGNSTLNTPVAVRALVHSELLLEALHDGFLPDGLHRDVSDFGDGSTLQIPVLGEMSLFDLQEEQDTPSSALSTGSINLTITNHMGVAGYITDELKEDGYKAAAVESAIVPTALRSLKEAYESTLLASAVSTANGIIKLGNPNTLDGADHRWIANGTNNIITLEDFIYAKYSMDRASVPEENRIAIVDPLVEATLNSLGNLVNVSNNPQFEGIVNTGFARGRRFVKNVYGFDVYVSNRLPRITSESITSTSAPGAATISGGVNNIFMSVADDQTTPFMGAWRRAPRVEGHRNISKRRDEYHVTARWGFAPQRGESLISVITSGTAYK